MMSKTKIALLIFILVSVLDILGIILKIPTLIFIFKPLILPSLLFLYGLSVFKRNHVYVLAVILSFFGDVFLLFSGEFYFIIGLISFLLAHLLFIKIVLNRLKNISIKIILISILPFLVIVSLLLFILKNYLNQMLYPVVIYGLTIATFGTVSSINFLKKKSKKSLFMLVGAVTFIISDSVLAINKFYSSQHYFEIIIMLTYILAQYFIYKSMVEKTA